MGTATKEYGTFGGEQRHSSAENVNPENSRYSAGK